MLLSFQLLASTTSALQELDAVILIGGEAAISRASWVQFVVHPGVLGVRIGPN